MKPERNNSEMKQNNGEATTETTATKPDEKRDKRDWIDHEHYTELGGEG